MRDKNFRMKKEIKTLITMINIKSDRQRHHHFKNMMVDAQVESEKQPQQQK